jgi:hypothetical protein
MNMDKMSVCCLFDLLYSSSVDRHESKPLERLRLGSSRSTGSWQGEEGKKVKLIGSSRVSWPYRTACGSRRWRHQRAKTATKPVSWSAVPADWCSVAATAKRKLRLEMQQGS